MTSQVLESPFIMSSCIMISCPGPRFLRELNLSHHKRLWYCKFPKYSDTQKICCNHFKIWTMWLHHRVMCPNDADRMANSVGPDQTAPLGAVCYGSALFAQAYLSKNLGSLLFVLRKLILQIHMCSHPVGFDVWCLVGPFIYFHTSCVRTAKDQMARLCRCAGSSEPSLVTYKCDKYHNLMSWLI